MNFTNSAPSISTHMAPLALTASNRLWVAAFLAGSSLLTGSSMAVDNLWLGTTSDWNTATNWSLGRVPTKTNGQPAPNDFDDAVINVKTPNPALISADISVTPRDILVGINAGADGRLDHTAGAAATGAGNWMNVGAGTGTGVYNLANTAVAGGGFTGFAQGSGSMIVSGRLQIGQAGSNGTVNVNTTGSLTINGGGGDAFKIGEGVNGVGRVNLDGGTIDVPNGEMWVGQASGGNGTLQMSAGTLNVGNWVAIGRNTGATGTVNFSGGTINKTGGGQWIVGDNGNGTMTQTGGTLNVNNEFWVGQGGTSNSSYVMSAGQINVGSWVAIGRDGGTGKMDMSGGSFVKTGAGSNFIVGASGPGTLDQTAGLTDVQGGISWIGETNNATGNLNLSGTAEYRTSVMELGVNGGATGNANLNGGTLRVGQLRGGNGTANASFNGTQIVATADQAAFINNLDTATVAAGGLKVDTNSFSVGVTQVLSGIGAVTKSGTGTLTLGGSNAYTGGTTVTGGTLLINGSQTLATGLVSVGSGATLGGSGTSGGGLALNGGTLAPGNSAGTLTSMGSAAFDANAILAFELLGTDQTVGAGINDLLTGVTNLTLDGTLNVTDLGAGSFLSATVGNSWRLINYTGSLTNNGLALGTTPSLTGGLAFAVDTTTVGQVNLVVVPEPTTTVVLGAALAAFGLRRRRTC
jgi:autotransporter-associated beta strand protein